MKDIFISYRRSDSSDVTGRICDHLKMRFGEQRLFKDVDSIPLGSDFRNSISKAVAQCKVLLAVIGPDWLEATDDQGKRRIDDPNDYVYIEIASALERNIPVIPILVNNGEIPGKDELPHKLVPLSFRNGSRVRADPDFTSDIKRVMDALAQYVSKYSSNVEELEPQDFEEPDSPSVVIAPPASTAAGTVALPRHAKRSFLTRPFFWVGFVLFVLLTTTCISCSAFFLLGNSLLNSGRMLVRQTISDDPEVSDKLGQPITIEDFQLSGDVDEDGRYSTICNAEGSKESARVTGYLTMRGFAFDQGEFVITFDDKTELVLPRK